MALVSFPLQSSYAGDDEYGNPIFDRAVDSAFYRGFWRKYWTDGIFYDPADAFQVAAIVLSGLNVRVKLGECHMRGLTAQPDENVYETLTLSPSSPTADRKDRIVIRADFENERQTTIEVRENWLATDSLTRNSNVWELAIADVLVKKNAIAIHASDVTDLRLNSDLCGVVGEPVVRTNTTVYFNQIQDQIARIADEWDTQENFQENMFSVALNYWRSSFENWFNTAQTDLNLAAGFDFWNAARAPGAYYATEFPADGSVKTTIRKTSGNTLVAVGITTYPVNGSVVYEETAYQPDGQTVFRRTRETTTYPGSTIRKDVATF